MVHARRASRKALCVVWPGQSREKGDPRAREGEDKRKKEKKEKKKRIKKEAWKWDRN